MVDWDKLALHEGRVLTDGEEVTFDLQDHGVIMPQVCCDCSLTHNVLYRLRGTKLTLQVWRDDRTTALIRAQIKKVCSSREFVDSFREAHDFIEQQKQGDQGE